MRYLALFLLTLVPFSATAAQHAPRVYVANQEAATVSVIDMTSNQVVATVDLKRLGFPATSKPHHTAVTKGGDYWFVSLIAAGKVLKFSRDNELIGQADFSTPGMLALHPDEQMLFVGRSMAAVNPPPRIGKIDIADMSIQELDVFFPRPHALAVHPQGSRVFTGSLATNSIASVDFESETLELTTVAPDPTHGDMAHVFVQFAVSPDGTRLVATGEMTGKLLVFDSSNPDALRPLHSIEVQAAPWHPTFTPDGRWVYFGNQRADAVTVVDTRTWKVAKVITGGGISQPHGIAPSPDGRYIYVSNRNLSGTYKPVHTTASADHVGTVVVINVATQQVERVIEVGHYAAGLSAPAARD